ncbi:MAG: hypothetical protein C4K60_07930 [Ideonella sp. MAG2]|nr:MAG: hypothetical protein C4K60_07930 [Ideonella sp. MAG2]
MAYAQAEGHQCDPLLDSGGLAVRGRYFTIENSLACGQHWTDYITFRYEPTLNRFVFHKRIVETWRLNSSASSNAPALVLSHRRVTDAAQDKPVFLEAYRARP